MTGAEHYKAAQIRLAQAEQAYIENRGSAAQHHREMAAVHAQLAAVTVSVAASWTLFGAETCEAWQQALNDG